MPSPRRRPSYATAFTHLGVIVAVSAVLGVLVAGLALPFVGAASLTTKQAAASMKELPAELRADPLAQRSRLLGRGGALIATFYDQNRVNVPLEQVSGEMRQAIVAIEDDRFYEHGALDLQGTLRAFLTNQANDGVTQGGSSITQQLAKMTRLTQARTQEERRAATDDTYQRKIQELRHAIAFEQNYSKDWILERYLNTAYFGDGTYGVQSAARHYFSVDAAELDVLQAATLAGLVKNPVGYDPTNYPDRATARRNVVLERMSVLGLISAPDTQKLTGRKLGLKVTAATNGCLGSKAPFFCDYVRRYLLADPSLGRTEEDRAALLNGGGLTIKTSLDLRYQRAADEATASAVDPTDQAIGALAMVQPGTGDVMAISQSRPMGRKRAEGQTFLNYVVNSKYGDSNGFQAGSTFKVFVLGAALEQGLPTSTSFNSPEQVSIPANEFEDCDGPYSDSAPWEPRNSTSSGTFDMYKGTQLSVNTYYAQLERKTGLCDPYKLARKMGVELTDPDTERVPSFVLGVADVSPLEMAEANATFAARGVHCDSRPVTEVLNSEGKRFKHYPRRCSRVMEESNADTVNDILRGVMAPGGFGQRLALSKVSAGKTGTTNSNMAVWFNGYTPTLSTAAMIAGANEQGQPTSLNGQRVGGSYISAAFGSTVAGPMWASAMRTISSYLPDADFGEPIPGIKGLPTTVPDVVGSSIEDATEELEEAGFRVKVGKEQDSDEPAGTVAATSPESEADIRTGATITLLPSRGSDDESDSPSPSPTSSSSTPER